jgi:hypothetical protein
MHDIREVRAALNANAQSIIHLWPQFTPEPFADPRDELLWGYSAAGEVVLRLGRMPLCFPARVGPPAVEEAPSLGLIVLLGPPPPPRMKNWGLAKLGPGVWGVTPSIIGGGIHAYVVLCGAPDPAPWEAP